MTKALIQNRINK